MLTQPAELLLCFSTDAQKVEIVTWLLPETDCIVLLRCSLGESYALAKQASERRFPLNAVRRISDIDFAALGIDANRCEKCSGNSGSLLLHDLIKTIG